LPGPLFWLRRGGRRRGGAATLALVKSLSFGLPFEAGMPLEAAIQQRCGSVLKSK